MDMLLGLIASHFVCDFALQSDWVGKHKSPRCGQSFWPWVMAAHAATHAAGTYVVTGSTAAALFQFFAHAWIDIGKCLGAIGFHVDQVAHLCCAVAIWLCVRAAA